MLGELPYTYIINDKLISTWIQIYFLTYLEYTALLNSKEIIFNLLNF